ncbi:hypothetical protein GCM10011490_24850 [Pseudoclavibacter endophyticus]|uniref:SprT family zinc-dependent metalloprotease n=1 Tax=Pseudoclavibacter endophyticus TaxID=1778590 RepID=A0A6H9WHE7_9MICO|nr:SprT-like domain-containing protein [Pseudoclavibacter endophyticus]KAB1647817.1 SprT family zinc-dependent metalloprotease [Pseudoclavibacter endophyticus]GGA73062.1 hypothetical protein GCM10011490_24850 [Pseudoclavibacter endophyticus]
MADLAEVERLAIMLMRQHLPAGWSFAFDRAKKRAGACDHTKRRITLSRYLAAKHPIDAMQQTMLHEIAHAVAGPRAAHGPDWRTTARRLGYTGGTTHTLEVATEYARWIGHCPHGHEFVRFRRPAAGRARSCGRCSSRFDRRYVITWRERTPSTDAAA